MANNKIQLANGEVLIDLTGDTVTPESLEAGITAHNAAGEQITGTRSINSLDTSTDLDDGDFVPFFDSSAGESRKSTWETVKAFLKSYFDGLFATKTHASTHAAGGSDALTVTTEMIAANAVIKHYAATIGTTWTGTAAPYTQEISVSGILVTDRPIVDVVLSDTYATAQAQLDAWQSIFRIVTAANKITVYAHSKTTTAISIQLEVSRR